MISWLSYGIMAYITCVYFYEINFSLLASFQPNQFVNIDLIFVYQGNYLNRLGWYWHLYLQFNMIDLFITAEIIKHPWPISIFCNAK